MKNSHIESKIPEIRLTKKQINRLLEMCNKLYPQYKRFFTVSCEMLYYSKRGDFPGFSINWLELCLYHLPNVLFENMNESDLDEESFEDFSIDGSSYGSHDLMIQMIHNIPEINPIDYLYKYVYKKYVK
jgi:hypothetical protein